MGAQISVNSAQSKRVLNFVLWALQIAIGALFVFAGASKLLGASDMVAFFAELGYGQWLRYFFGVLEVSSGLALVFPRSAFYGAVLLSLSLAGHMFMHAFVLRRPAGFLVLLFAASALIAYFRSPVRGEDSRS
jgi:uncharacterized membrane protein YphA (DoxX/SURF4 family)